MSGKALKILDFPMLDTYTYPITYVVNDDNVAH